MKNKREPGKRQASGLAVLDRFESVSPWKRGLAVAVFLIVVLGALVPELYFKNDIFLVPDTKAPISFAAVGKKALESGTYPLWNPYLFCGMPSYQSLAYTPYVYPVSFVTYLLHRYLGFPEIVWLLLHYVLAGAGVYLLMRSLGVRATVSLLAGAIFMLLPNFIALGANGHGSKVCAIAYMPYALLLANHILRGRRCVIMTSLLAITLGFQILRGHIQISYYTYLFIGLLVVFELVRLLRGGERRAAAVRAACIAVSVIAAVAIAAVLIFPVRDYAAHSIRGAVGGGLDYGYATGWSLHPKEVLTFFFPWAYGFGKITYWGEMTFTDYPNYLGVLTCLFAAAALFLVRHRWKWFLVIAAVVSTIVSFGKYLPVLYGPMFKLVPFFNKFRVPVMILIIQQLALVLLMGLGLDEILNRVNARQVSPGVKRKVRYGLIAGLVVFVLVLIARNQIEGSIVRRLYDAKRIGGEYGNLAASAYWIDLLRTIALFVAAGCVVYLSLSTRILTGTLVLLFTVVGLVDLFTVNHPVLHPERTWRNEGYRIIKPIDEREEYLAPDPLMEFLSSDDSYFRVFPAPFAPQGRQHLFGDNRFMTAGIPSLGGYHAAKLQVYQDVLDVMFEAFNRRMFPFQILNMLNAKYIIAALPLFRDDPSFPLVWENGETFVYRNENVLPRMFFVSSYRVVSRQEALRSLISPVFDPSKEVLLDSEPAAAPQSAEGSTAQIGEYRLNSIRIRAHVEKPCILVLSEIFYPDWKVEVNGAQSDVLAADYCLRALSLPSGDHDIVFRYVSRTLRVSLVLSVTAFVCAVAIPVLYGLLLRRRG